MPLEYTVSPSPREPICDECGLTIKECNEKAIQRLIEEGRLKIQDYTANG